MVTLWVAGFIAAIIIFILVKARLSYLALPLLKKSEATGDADVTVIIPARNEERNIARAVKSFPGIRVIVVDDDSGDKTAEVARAAGAEVIAAPPVKKGAPGKPAACQAGARLAATEYILFVDADTWFEPEFLPSLLAEARREEAFLVTAFLKHQCSTLSEKIVQPYAFALAFFGVSARRANSPVARDAFGNGQCMLFRRGPYEFMGGHGAVANSFVDDVKIVSLAKRHRMKIRVMRADNLGSVRVEGGFNGLWLSYEKNSVRYPLVNPSCGMKLTASSILFTFYAPVLALLLWNRMWIYAGVFGAVPMVLLLPWYTSILGALLSPLAIYAYPGIVMLAMFASLHGRTVKWKGRPV
jgi:glycosyltransferase involved in cell wall biosynthesis